MKLEIRGDKVKIVINIQEPLGLSYDGATLYLYHEAGDHLSAIKVDWIESIDGVLTYQNRTDWQNIFQTERDLYTFDGVAVVYNDTHYYIGDFEDKDRKGYDLVKRERRPVIAQMIPEEEVVEVTGVMEQREESVKPQNVFAESEISSVEPERKMAEEPPKMSFVEENKSEDSWKKPLATGENLTKSPQVSTESLEEKKPEENIGMPPSGLCETCPYQKRREEQKKQTDAFEEMIEKYPKLPMYGVTELFDCVRIHPRDIGKLDMRNWKLGVNSFLTHSFYTYQYLLLGKLRFEDGKQQCIIGVPGVYSNRERYLANMFGFDHFIPVKQTGMKTGEFGYWIVEIMPSL